MASKSIFQEIPQLKGAHGVLKTIERKLTKIPNDAESFVENVRLLRDSFSTLFNKYYGLFTQTPLADRQVLIETIVEMVKKLSTMKDETITEEEWLTYKEEQGITIEDEWKSFEEHLENFRWLCTYEFKHYNESPLKFAQTSVLTLSYINDLEEGLFKLMEYIDSQLKNKSDPIFEKECQKLKNSRRDVVLTCLGGLKSTKSSFINFLLNESICPTGNAESTARLTKIRYGSKLSVCLKHYNGTESQVEECEDIKELHKKLVAMVKLDGKDNRSKGCRDEVIVQLPKDELKGIELWDIPGFDENEIIDEQIASILANTDIIFALMPLRDTFRRSFEHYVRLGIAKDDTRNNNAQRKKVSESLVCFIITCIDQFCEDDQTKLPREIVLEQLFQKLENTFGMNLSGSSGKCLYKDADRFLSMCTDVRFSLRDHLECREQFIEKSSKWYQAALTDLIKDRLNWLQCNIQKLLDFYNAEREMDRCEKLIATVKQSVKNMNQELLQMLDQDLEVMKTNINKSLQLHTIQTVQTLNQYEDITTEHISEMQENITSMHKKEYESYLNELQTKITQRITQHINQLILSTESTLQSRQLMTHILLCANDSDPYKFQNGRYTNISRLSKEDFSTKMQHSAICGASGGAFGGLLSGIVFTIATGGVGVLALPIFVGAGAAISTSVYTLATATTESIKFLYSYTKEKLREKQLQNDVNKYLIYIMDRSHKIIVQRAHESLQNITQDLNKRLINEVNERKRFLQNVKQPSQVTKILDSQLPSLKKLYLNILDREFDLVYSKEFQIHKNELLGKSNFAVWKGRLSNIPIAVKLLPLSVFNLNEIRYFKELDHPNIVKYYGVKKEDELNYCIVMEYFDFTVLDFLNLRKEKKRLFSSEEIDNMLRQINRGLLFIHKANIVHRDIKPTNILVKYHEDTVKNIRYAIADFGLAHMEPRSIVGTPGYIAPEIFDKNLGETTTKSDIYSFGVVIQEVLVCVSKELENDVLIRKWKEISKMCVNKTIHQRPTCEQIEEFLSRE